MLDGAGADARRPDSRTISVEKSAAACESLSVRRQLATIATPAAP
jgi:hypothetical protein